MRSMIWSAVLVHLKGRACSFQSLIHSSSALVLIHSSSALVRSSREQKIPRSRQRRCSSASQRSTWLIHDEYVGVKCSTKCGWASSQRCTGGALCAEVVADQVDVQAGVGLTVDLVEEVAEVDRP